MKYTLNGKFISCFTQAAFLREKGIDVNMENGEMILPSLDDYLISMELLYKNGFLTEKNYLENIKEKLEFLNKKQEEKIENEKYTLKTDDKSLLISTEGNDKFLAITEYDDKLYVVGKGESIYNERLEKQEISFSFKKDSELYNNIHFLFNNRTGIEKLKNKNIDNIYGTDYRSIDKYIKIEKRKDEYRLCIIDDNAKLNDDSIAFEVKNSRLNDFYKNIYKNDCQSEKIMLKVK